MVITSYKMYEVEADKNLAGSNKIKKRKGRVSMKESFKFSIQYFPLFVSV